MFDLLLIVLLLLVLWFLQFAIVVAVALASAWLLGFWGERERTRRWAWVMVGIWLVSLVVSNAYWGYSGWLQDHWDAQVLALQGPLKQQAKEAAERQGEVVPPEVPLPPDAKANPPKVFPPQPGPIYTAEFYTRSQQAQERLYRQSWLPNIKSEAAEKFLWLLWFACALAVAGYCVAVLRKPAGWFRATALALVVTFAQCLVVGVPTFVLTIFAYLWLGGQILE